MSPRRGLASLLLGLALANATCAPVPLGDGNRRVVVRAVTEEVIVPLYDDVVVAAGALREAATSFAAAPDPTALAAVQAAWRAARLPWKHADAFAFGPYDTERFGVLIDQFPVEIPKIEEELSGTEPLTPAHVAAIGADRKGFHAIEYLLFTGDVLAAFTTDALAARRRDLLVAYTTDLEAKAGALRDTWASAADAYAETFTDPGGDNPLYPTIKSVVDTLVNECLFQTEIVSDARLGKPLGMQTGGTPQPALEESGPSDNSLADMRATVESIAISYQGTRTPDLSQPSAGGVGLLVVKQAPATDRDVSASITRALALIDAIPRPFKVAIVDHRAAVQAAYDELKNLKSLVGTEVVAALGATLKFNDNDGD